MRLLVFGQGGQVARALAAQAPQATCLGRAAGLATADDFADAVRAHAPDAVINAAAFTDVNGAETAEAEALLLNAAAPGAMAAACAGLGVPFVHISTDYVFADDGSTAPRAPDAPTGPPERLGAYGRTKLAGEAAVRAAGGVSVILRTSWVFSAHGGNFLDTVLRLAGQHDRLTMIDDQVGGPTPAEAIARACLTIAAALRADPGKAGVYHFSGEPDVSWADFACEILAVSKASVPVARISTAEYSADKPGYAARPLNSRLDCASLQSNFGITRPDWKAAVTAIVEGR